MFRSKQKFKDHMRIRLLYHIISREKTHTSEKPFEYKSCGKFFRFSSNLKSHMRRHTSEKLFKCKHCGKCFSNSVSLEVHLRVHTDQRPYKCEYCGKSFKDSCSLVEHVRTHTGEKPYECKNCGKRFICKSAMDFRTKVHLGIKFTCKHCGKQSYASHSGLRYHEKMRLEAKVFECDYCKGIHYKKNSLARHIISKHMNCESNIICLFCSEKFKNIITLQNHFQKYYGIGMKSVSDPKCTNYVCLYCSTVFDNVVDLKFHIQSHYEL